MNTLDLSTLAQNVVALLIPLVPFIIKLGEGAAEEIGKDAWGKAKELYRSIKSRFEKDDDGQALKTLDLFLTEPDLYKAALAELIKRKVEKYPDFGQEVKRLLDQAGNNESLFHFVNNYYGNIDQQINIGWVQTLRLKD